MDRKAYYSMFAEAWRFFCKYAERIPLDGSAWEELIDEMTIFVNRHPECERMSKKLIIAIEDELEHLTKAS